MQTPPGRQADLSFIQGQPRSVRDVTRDQVVWAPALCQHGVCGGGVCMLSTNSVVSRTEWFHSPAHCLQEKPHQGHGAAGEIRGFHPGYHRGRKRPVTARPSLAPLPFRPPLASSPPVCGGEPSPRRAVKPLSLCSAVRPHADSRGRLHGPLEHCSPAAAERRLSRCH